MKELFENETAVHNTTNDPNPLVRVYGIKEGEVCKSCLHFKRKQLSKTYFKCALRKNTPTEKTDIRANWNACGKFEPLSTPQ